VSSESSNSVTKAARSGSGNSGKATVTHLLAASPPPVSWTLTQFSTNAVTASLPPMRSVLRSSFCFAME
jgi:hypothetical protein